MIGERDILLPKLMILAGIVALAVLALFTMKYPILLIGDAFVVPSILGMIVQMALDWYDLRDAMRRRTWRLRPGDE